VRKADNYLFGAGAMAGIIAAFVLLLLLLVVLLIVVIFLCRLQTYNSSISEMICIMQISRDNELQMNFVSVTVQNSSHYSV